MVYSRPMSEEITSSEATEILGISKQTFDKWVLKGRIKVATTRAFGKVTYRFFNKGEITALKSQIDPNAINGKPLLKPAKAPKKRT